MNTRQDRGVDIADWRPEDEKFWETTGKKIAYRNLWISVPACCVALRSGACGESSRCRC